MSLVCIACGGAMERGHFCVELVAAFGPVPQKLEPWQREFLDNLREKMAEPTVEDLDHRFKPRRWRP